jgi:hypothetical protein
MSESLDPLTTDEPVRDISRRGILVSMAVIAAVAAVAVFVLVGRYEGIAVVLGSILSYVNYLWLDRSTKAILAGEGLTTSGILAARYVLRFVALGGVLWLIYQIRVLPLAYVILGLSSFALAVVFQGLRNIFIKAE